MSSTSSLVTLVDVLRERGLRAPEDRAYAFLPEGEAEGVSLTWGELDGRARGIAAVLQEHGLGGERILLLFQPGLDFVAAFFGCLYAGAVAVPCYPPRSERNLSRLLSIAADASPRAALTGAAVSPAIPRWKRAAPELERIAWIDVDALPPGAEEAWREPEIGSGSLAFLQYTSGSTSTPKGVMVSHGNLIHNERLIQHAFRQSQGSLVVGWLPLYHDMGLIGNVLQPLWSGGSCVLMPPLAFLQKPRRWLEAIHRYRATTSGGPNFAYELCLQKIAPAEREGLDLSSWTVAFNGAEPVRAATQERFAEAFASCGFRREAFYPCYGLAEATLFVSGGVPGEPAVVRELDAEALARNRAEVPRPGAPARSLVSCGRPWLGQTVAVVDPESGIPCEPGAVGEVWVAGASVTDGYWNRPEETAGAFGALLPDSAEGPFLRTGDLGFVLDGELYLAGRLKDLVILRGRNHYPQDLELTAERSHRALRPGCGAAFSVEVEGTERLVVVQEVERHPGAGMEEIADAIRQAIAEEHEVQVHEVVLARFGAVPKTTSGKVQRRLCRSLYLEDRLPRVGSSVLAEAAAAAGAGDQESGPEGFLRRTFARLARLDPARVAPDRPLTALGLDSLMAVELKAGVEAEYGVPLPLASLLEGATLRDIAGLLAGGPAAGGGLPMPGTGAPEIGDLPLSEGQKALWFLDRLAPESGAYNIAVAARVLGGLDAGALRCALEALVLRHSALRSVFSVAGEERGGEPVRRVLERPEIDFRIEDAAGWSEDRLQAELAAEAWRPFDLGRGPLVRVRIFDRGIGDIGGADPVLLLVVHHIVADFASLAVAARELAEGGALPPRVTYGDFVRWQEEALSGPRGERLWDFWREALAGVPDLDLPTDRPRPPVQTWRGGARTLELPPALAEGARALAAARGATPFMVLLAAFQAQLGRISGQDDLAVGTPTAGRSLPELAPLMGYFVNPVALRVDLSGEPSFAALLARVRRTAIDGLEHGGFPFARIAARLRPVRDPSRPPIFQTLFLLQGPRPGDPPGLATFALGESGGRLSLGGLEIESLRIEERRAQFDLTLRVTEDGAGRMRAALEFNADLFDAATAERMLGHWQTLLAVAVADPSRAVWRLPLLTPAEREQLLVAWNATLADSPADLLLHQLFEAQAARTPAAEAVVAGEERLTYQELNARANRLARHLRTLGVGPEVRVGIQLGRGADLIVALLAVLKAGGAYVPLDPKYPQERLELMRADSGARVVIEDLAAIDLASHDASDLAPSAQPGNLAYLIYTSGSTGRPKAVALEHRSPVALVHWARRVFSSQELSGVLASTSTAFDLSVFEIFVPLSWGGRVILAENALELPRLAAAGEVRLVNTVPSALAELVRGGGLPSSVRTVNLAGEPVPPALADAVCAIPGVERLYNLYGPSEDTTYSTFTRLVSGRPVTIGRPLDGTRAYVLDRRLEPVPEGVPGELYLGGAGLARGYLGRPDLTAERFMPDPFGEGRLYRTGDLVRWRNAELEFLGRIDHQVKIRGFRIELGEIEAALSRHPAVREAAVLALPERSGDGLRLVAYVSLSGEEPALAAWLRERLPEAFVPTAWVVLPALPLSPNGKVSREALARIEPAATVVAGEAPRTPLEETLAGMFAGVLGLERVGVHDDFFALGGHSLLATRLISRLNWTFGADLPVSAVFQAPSVAALAGRLSAVPAAATPPLLPVPRTRHLPLSFAQQRLWFLDRLQPGSAAYNMPGGVRLDGPLAVPALAASLAEVERRHETLRTVFQDLDGAPVQAISPVPPLPVVPLPVLDLSGLPEAARAAEAERLELEEARLPFDLARGPVWRARLVRLGAEEHRLLVNLHHITADGWSLGLLLREVAALYDGRPAALPELPVQYADYAVWQRDWLQGEALERQLGWWRERLAGLPVVEFPSDRPRPAVRDFRGGLRSTTIPAALAWEAEALARREGGTLFMALLGAVQALLARYTGEEAVAIGSPVANRRPIEVEPLIGFFVNTLVLPVRLGDNPSFHTLLGRVREVCLGAYAHQDLPFERLVEELHPGRDLSQNPLFQVMFVLQEPLPRQRVGALSLAPGRLGNGTAKLDLTLAVTPRPDGGWDLEAEHAATLFDAATIDRLLGHFESLLAGAVADPSRPLSQLPVLTDAERHQLLGRWSGPGERFPAETPLHRLFEACAARSPGAVAATCGGASVTYGELDRRANRLARRLRRLGVGPEVRVGLCAERSLALVEGLLAILKAGGAYVPLDPRVPAERLAWIVEDSGLRVVVADGGSAALLPPSMPVVSLADPEAEEGESAEPLAGGAVAANAAYVIYTSGSTGRPKGVVVPHAQAARLLAATQPWFGFHGGDVWTLFHSFAFDFSVWEIWGALAYGGRLVVVPYEVTRSPEDFYRLLLDEGVTVLNQTPSAFRQLLAAEALRPAAAALALRWVIFGGEALEPSSLAPWFERRPGGAGPRLVNMYGITETTVHVTFRPVSAADATDAAASAASLVGVPIPDLRIYLLDRGFEPVPALVAGEIHVGGDGLARGYLERPELTAERFVPDPFGGVPGARLYRSGDLARWRPDGDLEYLGRIDHQVKIRGFRIEPGEIQAALVSHPGVRDAVVLALDGGADGERRLAGYVVPSVSDSPSPGELRRFLRERLPDYMVPADLVFLATLPLTSNGKVDRRALAALCRPAPDGAVVEAPRTPAEELMAGIWSKVLGRERVGIHDDFFDLGGHSLLAIRLISRLNRVFGVDLPVSAVFQAPTVAALVEKLSTVSAAPPPPIEPGPRSGDLPLSFAQQRLWFLDRLQPGSAAYNIAGALRLAGSLDPAAFAACLDEVVARHEALRTTFHQLGGEAVQRIAARGSFTLPVVDLSGLPELRREVEARRLATAEAELPFDLARGPLLRATLLRLGREDHVALLTLHHIVSDGWSMGALVREVVALYPAFRSGRPSPLPPLPVQYADFALWQRDWLRGEVLEAHLRYWRERLAGAPPALELPADRPRPAVFSGRGGLRTAVLPVEVASGLAAFGRREGTTLFMTLLTAFQVMLHRYTGQEDLLVGTPIANRNRAEVEDLIGFFANTLVLRTDVSGSSSFRDLAGRVREEALGAYAHQDLPFERLVEVLAPERSLAHTPLFQVMFALQNDFLEGLELPGLTLSLFEVEATTAKVDLTLTATETGGGLTLSFEYGRDLFDAATADRMLGHLATLLAAAVGDPGLPAVDIPLLGEAERRQLLMAWCGTEAEVDLGSCLHELIVERARQAPDAVAAVCGGEALTYGELLRRAGGLAGRLRRLGVGPEVPVGVCLESSLDLVTGLLAVLAAGGVYLPLDPAYPRERLAFLLEDSGAPVVLTLERFAEVLPGHVDTLLLDAPEGEDADLAVLDGGAGPGSLAYLIYTSGSTGRPKGVGVEHGPAAAHMRSMAALFGLDRGDRDDRVLQFSSSSFDASLEQILPALISGATVVLRGPDLWQPSTFLGRIAELGLTVVDLPTAYWHQWMSDCDLRELPAGLRLRAVSLGGEAMSPEAARLWWGTPLAGIPLLNTYGPTEAVVSSTCLEVDREAAASSAGAVGIGRPLAGRKAFVLDSAMGLSPVGVPGELHLGGALLARGYQGRPELTAERFVPDPFASLHAAPGARLYRTGDLVRWRPDGTLDFLGRADQQVKIRGYRVELGEVEAALLALPEVREAAVVAQGSPAGEVRLLACVVAAEGREPSPAALRASLRERLPEHMLPAAWAVLPALPLTPNGKVDRRALVRIEPDLAAAPGAADLQAPSTPLEELIAGIWAGLLGRAAVGVRESFFDLGGHSLLATRVLSRVRETLGVEIPLRTLFEAPTVAGLARAAEAALRAEAGAVPPLVPVPRQGDLPLSFAQERLWFLDQLEPESSAYHIPVPVRMTGGLRPAVLAASLDAVVARHEALRTTFEPGAGGPVQRIVPSRRQDLPLIDLGALPARDREAETRRLTREEAERPFDLRRDPLLRSLLLRFGDQKHLLFLVQHHIVSDGWSMGVLVQEVSSLYRAFGEGRPSPLPELPVQYADYAVWQRGWLQGEVLEREKAWWRAELSGCPQVLELPVDRPRPPVLSGRGETVRLDLPAKLSGELADLSRRLGATLFMTLLAAFQALLARWSGQEELLTGTPIANRNRMEIEGLIGFFVNTLVLRGRVDVRASFAELVRCTRERTLAAYAHQDLPFEALVEELQPERDPSRSPLFQAMLTLQNAPLGRPDLPGVELSIPAADTRTAKFDLSLSLGEEEGALAGVLTGSADLFDRPTLARLAGHFRALLEAVAGDPQRPMGPMEEIALCTPAELHQALVEWNDTRAGAPELRGFHQLFAEQARRTPEAPAVLAEDGRLTYWELDQRSSRLAHRLLELGAGPGRLVALYLERSTDFVAGILAAHKAGAAYLPLDPAFPAERVESILADAAPAVLVTRTPLLAQLGAAGAALCLDQEEERLRHLPQEPPALAIEPEDLAYVIYTSGSTGGPKGVAVEHRHLTSYLQGALERLQPPSGASWGVVSTLAADLGHTCLFPALVTGGCLHVISADRAADPEAFADSCRHQPLDVLKIVPSHLAALESAQGAAVLPRLRLVLGGEAFDRGLAERLCAAVPAGCRVFNHYGPTETTVGVAACPVEVPLRGATVPLGRPLADTRAYVADAGQRPLPIGVPGELLLGGDHVARGYFRRPDLTAERFIPDPFGARGERLYRTGDRVRLLADGRLEFLGRIDRQVKIRGFRVELGEIEAVLAQHPAVRAAVVEARPDRRGERRLMAWFVAGEGVPASELESFLARRLPRPMVPAVFVPLESLPLTANGKVDRRALPEPEATAGASRAELLTPLEEVIAAIWADLLGLDRVGATESFFELGGHSLLATRAVSRLRAALGAEVPLRTLFEAPTVAGLARRIGAASPVAGEPIRPQPREGALPLSYGQQRLWFLDRLEPESSVYNMPAAVRLRGRLDRKALETALGEIVRRHEVLRTVFPESSGEPGQVVLPPREAELPVVDLGGLVSPEPELERLALEDAGRPFDLVRGPVLRASLVRLSEEHHALLLALHHVAGDGWSVGLFLRELSELYGSLAAGRPAELPELPIQYGDYAAWQREHLSGKVLGDLVGYWRQRLAGLPALELPADRPRPSVPSYRGAHERLSLPAELTRGLEVLGRREGVTLFMTLLGAFGILLSRYSGQEDFAVGSPIAGRSRGETEKLIGFFVNTLVLRCDVAGDPTFGALLAQVRETCLEAYAHQDAPFDRLVEELRPDRDLSRSPIFQVMLAFQDESRVMSLPGVQADLLILDGRTARFDLTLSITRSEAGLTGTAELATDLFDRATIRRLLHHFRVLLEGAAVGVGRRLSELPLLDAAERRQLLEEWNDTSRPYPRERTIPELFAEQAARWPERIAVELGAERLTYAELGRRAAALASRLRRLGVGPDEVVGLYGARSPEMIAGVLGILAAGGAYLPLDPSYPVERLAWMLADARARRVVGSLPEGLAGPEIEVIPLAVGDEAARFSPAPADPENLAYVMYTSGSTGRPKGVAVTHRNVVRLVRNSEFASFGPEEVFLHLAPLAFDASTLELWGPLLQGGRLVLMPPGLPSLASLGQVLREHEVTSLWLTAGLFHQMVDEQLADLAGLRQLLAGGDVLSPAHVQRLMTELPGCTLINGYGPTENTTFTCCHRVEPGFSGSVPIGRPITNTRVVVVDRWGSPVPAGVPGELLAGGEGLSRGYLYRPELTAERFVPDPWSEEPGGRLYRTGDLVRWRPGGVLEFLGRLDGQVKIRGHRVEVGEVEAALVRQAGVREAVVVACGEGAEGKRLVGYLVGETGTALDVESLHESLRGELPEPLVPSALVVLESLPLTANGKVDRGALRSAAGELPRAARESEAPRTPVEEVVAAIWADLLGLDRMGVKENFFALGGHSLLATRAAARLRTVLGVELPLRALFEAPTVAELASRVELLRAQGREAAPPIVPTPRDSDLPLSFAQERLWLLDRLEPGSAVYNIPVAVALRGTLRAGALAAALGEVVRRHEALRTTFAAVGGASCQRITSPVPVPLPRIDLAALPEALRRAETTRLAAEEAARPFDLAAGPLLRARLLRHAGDEHLALLTLHHIVSDGWSTGVLVSELAALYGAFAQGLPSPLPELALQYADFAAWQREWLCGGTLDSETAWWREQLAGAPEVLELPADRPRPPVQSLRGAKLAFSIEPGLTRMLYAVARRQGATLFTTLLAVYQALLVRYTGQTDFLVGAPVAGRTRSELEGLIGHFVNTLVLRARAEGDPPFADLLARARKTALDAFEHQDLPFDKLVAELRPERSLSRAPLIQVALALQNAPSPPLALPGLSLEPVAVESGTSRFDLTLVLAESAGGISGVIEHSTDLFDAETIQRLAGHFANLLASAADRPESRLSELEMMSGPELQQVLAGWNDTTAAYPREATVHGRFAEQVLRAPAAPAVEMGGESLSYGELARRAGRLARRLRRLGVGPESRVGFCLERTPDVATAMLGILEAGAAYVPLDLAYPWERLAFMVEDAGIAALVTLERLLTSLPVDVESRGLHVVCLDGEEAGEAAAEGSDAADSGADSIAYVMYTSGSTGRPKGVAVTHRGIVRLVVDTDYVDFGPADRVLQASTTAFDAATYEIWGALLNGACLVGVDRDVVLAPRRLAEELHRQRITATLLTTALFNQVAREVPDAFTPLRHVVFGGEAGDSDRLRQVVAAGPPARLINAYGPTEGTVITTVHTLTALGESAVSVPIGRPIANTRAYLLDRHLRPVPAGVPGELFAGGDGLARGYLGRPDLTAERFVPDACSGEAGARLYRTGDLARYLADGVIEFLGRIDQQVKIRGFRIEPGEVEASLSAHPAVAQCAVVAHRASAGLRLVAYVVPAEEGLTSEALRSSLRASLPEHLVPSLMLFLPSLPLSPNGKIDRRALPPPDSGLLGRREHVPPRNAVEELLAEIWSRLLEVERIGVDDDFFELGGHSLLAFQLITEVEDVLGVSLSLRAAFETPTLGALAERVALEIERLAGEDLLAQAWDQGEGTDVSAPPPQGGRA